VQSLPATGKSTPLPPGWIFANFERSYILLFIITQISSSLLCLETSSIENLVIYIKIYIIIDYLILRVCNNKNKI